MLAYFTNHLHEFAFSGICILSGVFLMRVLRRFVAVWRLIWAMPPVLVAIIIGGCLVINWAGEYERSQLQRMLEGFAPTYAQELELMGHANVAEKTAADDPRYLAMIEAGKRWLKANAMINDIYTLRHHANGETTMFVSSKTDNDPNGILEGGQERRTPTGEIFKEKLPELDTAFTGMPAFGKDVYSDRWGTWVSAFYPMHDAKGNVEAVLGIDFDAGVWVEAIRKARWTGCGGW